MAEQTNSCITCPPAFHQNSGCLAVSFVGEGIVLIDGDQRTTLAAREALNWQTVDVLCFDPNASSLLYASRIPQPGSTTKCVVVDANGDRVAACSLGQFRVTCARFIGEHRIAIGGNGPGVRIWNLSHGSLTEMLSDLQVPVPLRLHSTSSCVWAVGRSETWIRSLCSVAEEVVSHGVASVSVGERVFYATASEVSDPPSRRHALSLDSEVIAVAQGGGNIVVASKDQLQCVGSHQWVVSVDHAVQWIRVCEDHVATFSSDGVYSTWSLADGAVLLRGRLDVYQDLFVISHLIWDEIEAGVIVTLANRTDGRAVSYRQVNLADLTA